jgi:hypothetical protein
MSLRRVILVVAALMALPSLALAQTSRVESMSLQGDYIKDYTGIYTYTSCVTGVGNLIYGELGFTTAVTISPPVFDRSVGAVLQNLFDGKLGTWALHLREFTPSLGQGDIISHPGLSGGFDPNFNGNEAVDVMWGRKFGTTSLGLRLNRSFYRDKTEPLAPGVTTDFQFDPSGGTAPGVGNLNRNIFGLGGGLTFEMSANTKVDVSLLYQSRSFVNDQGTGNQKDEDNGGVTYLLAARAFYQWEPNVMVVPVFKYYSFDLSQRTEIPPAAATTSDNSLKGWQVGLAGNWTVGNNDLFVLGGTVASNTVDQQIPVFTFPAPANGKATETIAPELFAALETHINNWLTLRFGASKSAYRRTKIEPTSPPTGPGGTREITDSPFTMNIGAGVKLSTLQLDAILNQAFPQTMGWLGSGIPGIYFPKVTATYAF